MATTMSIICLVENKYSDQKSGAEYIWGCWLKDQYAPLRKIQVEGFLQYTQRWKTMPSMK